MKQLRVLLVLAGIFAMPLAAMESPAPTDADAQVEEITVIGQRTLMALRMQVEVAQDQVHLLFNELNTDDRFDVVCRVDERIFSKIKERKCMTQYAWNAHAEEGRAILDQRQGIANADTVSAQIEIESFEPRLREQMLAAVQKSPELFDAIVRHVQLLEQLTAAKKTYFGKDTE